jgi:hypothetical protein
MADSPKPAGNTVPLDIRGQLHRRGAAEARSIAVSRLPAGARLNAGTDNGDGTWTVTAAELDGLAVIAPFALRGRSTLGIAAVLADAAGGNKPPITTAFGVAVDFGEVPLPPPVAPPPAPRVVARPAPKPAAKPAPTARPAPRAATIPPPSPKPAAKPAPSAGPAPKPAAPKPAPPAPAAAPAVDMQTVALDIDTGLERSQTTGRITVVIGGIPAGGRLSTGAEMGDGSWILDSDQLPGLTMSVPASLTDDVDLNIVATANGGVSTAGVLTVPLSGEPPAEPAPEFEPEPEPAPEPKPAPMPEPPAAAGFVPVAYWKLDESQPGTVGDEMGGHAGRAHGAAGDGGAFDAVDTFDGIDDYIQVPHTADMVIAEGALTLWFNAYATGQGSIAAKGAREGDHLAFGVRGRKLHAVIRADGQTYAATGGTFGTNEWNQATVTWGGGGIRLYLNGEAVGAQDHAGGIAGIAGPWMFGAIEGAGGIGDFFHGQLDDIAVYARQLPAAAAHGLFEVGVIGLMEGELAAGDGRAATDRPLDLDAIPSDADDDPASLAVIDADEDEDDDDDDDNPPMAVASRPERADGDRPLNLAAIPSDADDDPASLAVIDADEDEDADDNPPMAVASLPERADGDRPLNLDAIPSDADDDPASLAAIDADEVEDADDNPPMAVTSRPERADGDRPLDLDAIPADADDDPASLAVIDTARPARPRGKPPVTLPAADGDGEVFVFAAGAGGDHFQQGDGWSDTTGPADADKAAAGSGGDGAVTLGPDGDIKEEGGKRLEW